MLVAIAALIVTARDCVQTATWLPRAATAAQCHCHFHCQYNNCHPLVYDLPRREPPTLAHNSHPPTLSRHLQTRPAFPILKTSYLRRTLRKVMLSSS